MKTHAPPGLRPALRATWREGLSIRSVSRDALAGLTVAVIALPLAMALGIASIPREVADALARDVGPWCTPPAIGLFTAVVGGFLISVLGGSRVQVGGPTAAFIPIVFTIAHEFGYQGLAVATLLAGLIVILMGVFRFGSLIKFIPYPVVTGFTAGIAVSIAVSQVRDFLGLPIASLPAEFVPRVQALAAAVPAADTATWLVGVGSLAVLIAMRRVVPKVPGAIVAVILAAGAVTMFHLDKAHGGSVETIGSRFGGIPSMLPTPHTPAIDLATLPKLLAPALTIALLCGIESLLSAVVADGMTGHRHDPDQELVAQGVANVASVFFLGLPATGAIARTVANIKAGGRTPLAGAFHAVFLLLCMMALAPLAKLIPLAALAAVLLVVAWNISEVDHFRALLRAPKADVVVLLATFVLTVVTDLTIGVGVGLVLASLLFMKRMAEVTGVAGLRTVPAEGEADEEPIDPKDPARLFDRAIPPGVEVFEITGPFFFGVADSLKDILNQFERPPKVFILRMRAVPHVDATGLHALDEFLHKCRRQGTTLLLGGVHAQPLFEFVKVGFDAKVGLENIFDNLDDALARAREIIKA
ncbi:MAG: sodium-independent anion transporter [Phycisphaerae bacterium]|nr:MAG: sodium-independent anion transporter [Phycisphaerae bacterium]